LIGDQLRAGRTVCHWLKPVRAVGSEASLKAQLKVEESALIANWNLCSVGWNRQA
jgi:hypothetical protein